MAASSPMYPVVLRVEGRSCLVVGGGPVAARKAAGLLACGAHVTLVAPVLHPAVEALRADHPIGAASGTLHILERRYRRGEAADFRLVVTATGDGEVDGEVAGRRGRRGRVGEQRRRRRASLVPAAFRPP